MSKNIEKGKASEAKIMMFLDQKGPSRLKDIGIGCKAVRGQEISWAFSVCKRLMAQGHLTKIKKGSAVFYDLAVRKEKVQPIVS